MADDLQRFLEDRPILARRPTLLDRAAKWSRRHKAVLAAAVVLLFLAVIALTVSNVLISQEQGRTQSALQQAIEARDKEREARLREAEALRNETEARQREADSLRSETEARQRAEENFRQARQVVDYLSQIAAEDLKDMPELHDLRKKILKTALKYYEAFIQQSGTDEALREELVASSTQVGDILSKIGNKPQAFVMYEVARLNAENVVMRKPTAAGFKQLYAIWDRQGSARLGLSNLLDVQQELRMSATQRRQITDLMAQRGKLLQEAVGQTGPARYDKLLTLVDDEEKALDRILSADQAKRLDQLVVQQRGTLAFRDPKVIAALQLNPEQEVRVTTILDDSRRPLAEQAVRSSTEQAMIREQVLAILTEEQKTKWQDLVGQPSQVVVLAGEKEAPPPVLGAGLEPPGSILASQLGLVNGQGLLVTSVQPNSPAAKAGLEVHDILWELDGKPVAGSLRALQQALAAIPPNTTVDAVVIRRGEKTTLQGLSLPGVVGADSIRIYIPTGVTGK
jgi:hypothetical protein